MPREGGAFLLRRVRRPGHGDSLLELTTATEQPAAASLRRLEHEYALAAYLDSDWAVRPLALVRRGGRAVLVLEDPGGEPLDLRLDRPLKVGQFLPLAISAAAALGQAHARGLVHKDVKPANLFVDLAGKVRLTGFGIASRLPRVRVAPEPAEVVAGTLAYIAPEQTGRMNRSIDSRSDLYSLGITFYEMLIGAPPFAAADSLEWLHCHIARRPTPPGELIPLPDALSEIVMKLLSKTAEARYQTAAGLEADLRHCLEAWERHGRIEPFAIGAHDISDRLRIPEKLYGREAEIANLIEAFDRVVADGAPMLMLVSGYSGIGKSSVVNELHGVLVPPRGLFAAGKFDQYKRDIPYATFAQAFQGLVRQLLAKSEAEIRVWRDELLSALGPGGQLMVDLIPELELIIGKQPAAPDLPPQETPNRFRMLFGRLLGVFARQEHPLALFLDDLQWLDAATLDLLAYLLTEPEIRYVLFVGAYRDNEVDPSHPLMQTLAAIRKAGARVDEIVLAPLALNDIGRLIADTLHSNALQVRPLARLVHDKTGGNPFFVIQFISALEEEGLLTFDPVAAVWRWNMAPIRAKSFTDNVVHLLVAKLKRLPGSTVEMLKLLACLGNVADVASLIAVAEASEEQIHSDLWQAELSGLVIRLEGLYKFLHDRVQEAAYSLIPQSERQAAHLRIGRLLLSQTAPEDITAKVFEIVNQLNRGAELITSPQERHTVAELNLIAGKRARQSTAYAAALTYLSMGGDLLPNDRWVQFYDLAFALEYYRAECEFLFGALKAAEDRLIPLSARAETLVDVSAIACLRLALFQTLDRNDRAVEICLEYLRRAGIAWSLRPTKEELRHEYERLWRSLANRSIEDLAGLPPMKDADQRATIDVLTSALAPILLTDTNLFCLAISRMANLSIEHGNSDGSCLAYAYLNLIYREELGDYQSGLRFGKLGVELAERGLDRFKARIYVSFGNACSPWNEHFRVGRPFVERAAAAARETGDVVFELYSHLLLISHRLTLEDPLADVEQGARETLQFARKLGFNQIIASVKSQLWFIRALRGLTRDLASFSDDEFDEALFEEELEADLRLGSPACWYWIRKTQAFFYANDFDRAVAAADKAEAYLWTSLTPFEEAEYHYFAGLARAAYCDAASASERPHHREALGRDAAWLDAIAKHNPQSFANRAALVAAEMARLDGRDLDALGLYEQAIRSARENGFVQNEAVAYEVAARFHGARGLETVANALMRSARACYRDWGANAKVRRLDQSHPDLRDEPALALPGATITAPASQLDVAAAVKAAQAVSSEIVLDDLIETLLIIAMQHAGADRGLLILYQGDQLKVEAEARTDHGAVEVTKLRADVAAHQLPESVLRYVIRTRASLLLDDATASQLFSGDPYIRRAQPRSMLCLPLIKQAKLVGLLYLENKLAPHAFTSERIALLDLLAAQAAISLENARLYEDLRDREGRIRSLIDSSIIGVFFWNLSSITGANDTFLKIIGYTREDLETGQVQWADITPPEYLALEEQLLEATRSTGSAPTYEREFIRKDGTRTPALIGSTLLEGSSEDGVSFVLDLTERKQAEAEREARQVAEAANRAKDAFLANMSHELRTPLNGILGYAQLLQRDTGLNERQLNGVDVIRHSSEHLLTLINDLLDYSKIEAGKVELSLTSVSLDNFLRTLTEIVEFKAKEKGLKLICEAAPDLPEAVRADERRLRQVLLNLLSNAVKFTDRGQVGLDVRLTAPNRIRFEVQDTGIGIAHDQLEAIFAPFDQVGDAQHRLGGTGLGLAISREIVRLMGGEIRVKSEIGAGSTFWFELALPSAAPRSAPEKSTRLVVGYEGPRKSVLIADDAADNRSLLIDLLGPLGFDVAGVSNGRELLKLAGTLRPDLVITDFVMPDMDGQEATRRLRRRRNLKVAPVIMVSAHASDTDEQTCLAAGADRFLSKPIDVERLLAEMADLMRLNWTYAPEAPGRPGAADAEGSFVAPPLQELEQLHRLAQTGVMREISRWAEQVALLGPIYGPFADHLRQLAAQYQSKAILSLAQELLEPKPGP